MSNDSNLTGAQLAGIIRCHTGGQGNPAAAQILEEFVVIPRSELPEVTVSDHPTIGYTTALAQQRYQPKLRFSPEDGDKMDGSWNRRIAYANLAVAEAVEQGLTEAKAKRNARRDELAAEFFGGTDTYLRLTPGCKDAIDRIIDLERSA